MKDSTTTEKDQLPVTIVIPYFSAPRRVFDAVRSALRQSHPVETVMVLSDGDAAVPAERLRRLDRRRVFVHTLPDNRGHFFAREVARRALGDGYIAYLDADDEVEAEWIAALMRSAEENDGVAFCDARIIRSVGRLSWSVKTRSVKPHRARQESAWQFAFHTSLYRSDRIAAVGGFDASFRIGYDTAFVSLVAQSGPFGVVSKPLYRCRERDYLSRRKSLTADTSTGYGSAARVEASERLQEIYRACGPLFATDPRSALTTLMAMRDPALEAEVRSRAEGLREKLETWRRRSASG